MGRNDLDGLGYRGARVLLTGGASGLGAATAQLLTDMGAQVHIADISEPAAPHASFTLLDLADFDGVRAACADLRQLGPFDFLFPIAGIPPHTFGPLHCLVVNYAGTRLFVEETLSALRDGCTIGLIASTAGRNWQAHLADHLEALAITTPEEVRAWYDARPEKLRDGYSPSKELLIVWIQQLAIALGQDRRIRVNAIAPCPIDTPFMASTAAHSGVDFHANYPYPLLGRMPTAEEQAWTLLLLSSPLNAAVTGATLFSDQGFAGGLLTGALAPPSFYAKRT